MKREAITMKTTKRTKLLGSAWIHFVLFVWHTMQLFVDVVVVIADCTGYPDGCCKSEQGVCEDIEGCAWTGGSFIDGHCEGYPLPCEHFWNDRSKCRLQGCTFGPNDEWTSGYFCTGTPIPKPQCTGIPNSCESYDNNRLSCLKIDGCTWVPDPYYSMFGECKGNSTSCEEFDSDECQCGRQGCNYNEDPPGVNESFYDAIMPLREDNDVFQGDGPAFWEKCRDSRDGSVCYKEGLAAQLLTIDGKWCSCGLCENGGIAFDCTKVLPSDYQGVVGRDCDGQCIFKSSPSTSIAPTTMEPTTVEPDATGIHTDALTTLEPTAPSTMEPTTVEPNAAGIHTDALTTLKPTAPSTMEPSTVEPDATGLHTDALTTLQPTTVAQTTFETTTISPNVDECSLERNQCKLLIFLNGIRMHKMNRRGECSVRCVLNAFLFIRKWQGWDCGEVCI